MSIEIQKAFLDSLDGEKGLPDKFYRLLIPGVDVWQEGDEFLMTHDQYLKNSWEKAFIFDRVIMEEEIGRRAESRQISDLKKRVKELMRDAMDAQAQHQSGMGWTDANKLISEFRALCAPEVKP